MLKGEYRIDNLSKKYTLAVQCCSQVRGPVAGGMVPGGGHSGTCAADLDVKRNYPTQEHTTLTPTTQCNIFTKNTHIFVQILVRPKIYLTNIMEGLHFI